MSWKCPSSIRRRGSSLSWLPGAVIWWREVILTTTSTGSKANSVHRYVNQHLVVKVFYIMSIYLKWLLSFYSAFLNCKVCIMSAFMYIKSDNDSAVQFDEVINPRIDVLPDCDRSRKVNRTLYFPSWFIWRQILLFICKSGVFFADLKSTLNK